MKKVLFATTALVATAGVAAADVTFGGYGRFGILHLENATNETTITSRFRLQIDATAESDGGVTFGARVRIQQDNDGDSNGANLGSDAASAGGTFRADRIETGINGVRYFARSGGLEVGVGNIFGAIDSMPGMYPVELGLTGLSYDYIINGAGTLSDTYDSDGNGTAGRNGVEVMYSAGDLSVHVSFSEQDLVAGNGNLEGERLAAHVAYTFSGWTVALGLQDSDQLGDTELALTVGGSVGAVDLTFGYADNGLNGDAISLAAGFDVGAATRISAVVMSTDGDIFSTAGAPGVNDDTVYGIGVNHDLGGGTSIRGGLQNNRQGNTVADLGVRFNF